ncbi:hypothetical protein R1sor_020558 [Riccia sorocarpa]|uniref:Reverse transcriptase n=1 Tax=Riccia sorocarpa TaxID=122646 RepID=A0ABD3IK00_9MARC
MKLVVGTYNVRGLCAKMARTKLRNGISSIKPSLGILAIQEHKLREENIQFLTSAIWPQATLFHLPATDGVLAHRNAIVIGGKGGVTIAWQQKYEDNDTPPLLTLKGCIKRAKYCQLWRRRQATARKDRQNMLTVKVHGLTLQLEADPSYIYTQLKLEEALNQLKAWEEEKARWLQHHLDKSIENIILQYVWGGDEDTRTRHRVDKKVLHQRKRDGGLGLMSWQAQAQAFAAKYIRWAYVPGTHPLKNWLLAAFDSIAAHRWGSSHHTWITSPSKGAWAPLSPIMLHLCKIWQSTAKLLGPLDQLPMKIWRNLSLWGPKSEGVRNTTRSACSGPYATLQLADIEQIGDITTDGQVCIPLQLAVPPGTRLPTPAFRSYKKILDSTTRYSAAYRCPSRFATSPTINPTWCARLKDEAPLQDELINSSHAAEGFQLSQGRLIPVPVRLIPASTDWCRAPVASFWIAQNKPLDRRLISWSHKDSILTALQWSDQLDFLAAQNTTIRRLVSADINQVHTRLRKWGDSHHIDPKDATIWNKLWSSGRTIKFVMLQWLILYRALPTNRWRHPQLTPNQEETWCTCCQARAV